MRIALALGAGLLLWLGWLIVTHEGDGGRRLWDRGARAFTPLVLPVAQGADALGPDAQFFSGIHTRIAPGPQGIRRDLMQIRADAGGWLVLHPCSALEAAQVLGWDLTCQYSVTAGNYAALVCVGGAQGWAYLNQTEMQTCPAG